MPEVATEPLTFKQIFETEAVPCSEGVAIPESVTLPEVKAPSAGVVNETIGFALEIVIVLKAVFEVLPLESTT